MKKKNIFDGVCTALVTPFSEGKVDFAAFDALIERQIESGVDALLVCGTTGESSTLSFEEKKEVFEFCRSKTAGRITAIAGTGSNDTRLACKLCELADTLGYDGTLVVTPYYNKATPQGLIEHYTAVASSSSLPMILYNVPSRTCVDIAPDVIKTLSENDKIVGIKEASASFSKFLSVVKTAPDGFAVYTGNDEYTLPSLSVGSNGVVSVVSNVAPKEMVTLVNSFKSGDLETSRRMHEKLLELMRAMFFEVNPSAAKYALTCLGLCKSEVRLPMVELQEENKRLVARILDDLELF